MIPKRATNVIWTEEQWRAIHEKEKNILVNAGAGSGKTAVLTERIIEILKSDVSLERLIVLTFTKAAASEMKERLRKKLKEEISKGFKGLNQALDYIDQANIQTFDSFALGLVRKYHYLIGVDRSINIGDKVIFKTIKNKILDEVFDELYESEDQGFYDLIGLFSIKNDNKVKDYIINIDNQLDLLANKEEFLENYHNVFYNDDFIKKNINEFIEILILEIKRITQRINRLKEKITDEALTKHVFDIEDVISGLLKAKTYEGIKDNIEVRLPIIPRKVEDENQKIQVNYEKEQIKKLIAKINDLLTYPSTNSMYEEILKTKSYSMTIIEVIKRINQRFNNFKNSKNIYDFMDVAKLAIKLVKENEELRENIKASTYEILIDEYQDTSDIQEILISYIANNNVYMVGDMKQSIYRFRNANPDIFKTKYQEFKFKKTGSTIDLSKNFRSRKEVIDNINLIFSQVMSLEIGGVDYQDNHQLIFGNEVYTKNKPYDNYDMDILYYDFEDYELNQHEIEAFIVANDIKKKIKDKYVIYDHIQKKLREICYNDIAILTPDKSQFDLYKKIFEYMQIPLVIHKEETFVRSNEIYTIKNILRCVYSLFDYQYLKDNFKDALFSFLRSFVLEIDDSIISRIYEGDLIEGLKIHCNDVYQGLTNISTSIQNSTSSQILGEIYHSFDIYEKIVKLGNVEQVENKLNYLLLKFKELDQLGFKLVDIIDYLEGIIDEKRLDIEYTPSKISKDNVVNMMSIHKSKGLEFSICYFPELDGRFNFRDSYDKVLFDKTLGIIIPVLDEGIKDTFYKDLFENKHKTEEISERLRVLYVALTRAREKMIIVLPKYDESYKEDLDLVPIVDRLGYRKFFDIFTSIKYSLKDYTKIAMPRVLSKDYQIIKNLDAINVTANQVIEKRQVCLRREEEKKFQASTETIGLIGRDVLQNMDLGTKIHEYFEVIDFSKDIKPQIDSFECDVKIKDKMINFFNLEIFKIKNIIKSYHEHQFTYNDNGIINGIIDLILETNDELIVIDYKLYDINKKEYEKQLLIYYNFLEQVSNKHISCYLYSIMLGELKELKFD